MVWYRFKPFEGDIFSNPPKPTNQTPNHLRRYDWMSIPNRFVPRFTPVTTFNTASTVMTTYLVVCSVRQQQRLKFIDFVFNPKILFVEVSKKPEPGSGNSGQKCGKNKMDQKSRNFSWALCGMIPGFQSPLFGRNFQDPKASGYFGPKSAGMQHWGRVKEPQENPLFIGDHNSMYK